MSDTQGPQLSNEAIRTLSKVRYRYSKSYPDDSDIEIQYEDEDDECHCDRLPGELYEDEDRKGLDELLGLKLIKDVSAKYQVQNGAIFCVTKWGIVEADRRRKLGQDFLRPLYQTSSGKFV